MQLAIVYSQCGDSDAAAAAAVGDDGLRRLEGEGVRTGHRCRDGDGQVR